MNRTGEWYRAAARTRLVFAVVALSACGRAATPSDSAASPRTSAQASGKHADFVVDPAELPAPVPAPVGPVGALPLRTIDQYDGVTFTAFVRTHSWLGWERDRDCKQGNLCTSIPNGKGKSRVLAQAIEDAHTVGMTTPPIGTDVVVARVTNYGPGADPTFFSCAVPDKQGAEQCYILLRRTAAGTQLIYVQLHGVGTTTPTLDFYDKSTQILVDCKHPNQKWFYAVADFGGCAQRTYGTTARALAATGPMWLSCVEGCCSAAYPFMRADEAGGDSVVWSERR